MALHKQFRSPHSPSPIYGIRGGFNIGDFERRGAQEAVAIASTSVAVSSPSAISPKARVVKVTVNITAGTGTVDVTIKSNSDTYATVVADSGVLSGIGSYDFFVGGWSSPASGDAGYQATQYGPGPAGDADANNPTGNQDTDDPVYGTNANYSGDVYNPTNFLSLAGDDIKVFAAVTGTITYNVQVTPVS